MFLAAYLFSDTSEVQAVPNLALGQPTWQHSPFDIARPHDGHAHRAVDGRRDNLWSEESCSHTGVDVTSPWWAVDLGTSGAAIDHVVVVNRGDSTTCKELSSEFIVHGCSR